MTHPRPIIIEPDLPVTMRDGTVLRADVWRVDDGGRRPTLLQRTPYDKGSGYISLWQSRVEPLAAVREGFNLVIQDVRGRYASEGHFRAHVQEMPDGYDTVGWVRAQPWSNGQVIGYGGSYVGATQLLAAVTAPEGLVGIMPRITAAEYWEGWSRRGGALELGFLLAWVSGVLATGELERRRRRGEDVGDLERQLLTLVSEPDAAYRELPVDRPTVLDELVPAYRTYLDNPARDSLWTLTAISRRYDAVAVPALHIGGWQDIFIAGTVQNYTELARRRDDQRLVVGPWAHGNGSAFVGRRWNGPQAAEDAVDIMGEQLAFAADCTAGRLPTGPPVRVFVQGADRWESESAWPPPDVEPLTWYLGSGPRGARSLAGDGALSTAVPEEAGADHFLYDPLDPVPTIGGTTFLPGLDQGINVGMLDQREVERRTDVLVFTSPPLDRDITIMGSVRVRLWAETSAEDTDWTARLCWVDERGTSLGVVDGIVRTRFQGDPTGRAWVPPRQAAERIIELGPTATRIPRGHRLRLQVSSSNFPRFDRHGNTRALPSSVVAGQMVVARQRVHHGRPYPSCVELQVRR